MTIINTIHLDLLGTDTRYYKTAAHVTRCIEVVNDKVPLLLLHGGGGHAETYSRNLTSLASVCRPMAIDFIWHGRSSSPPFAEGNASDDVHWLRQFTLQVIDFLDHHGFERAVIEGESLGGWVALDMAINFPQRTAGVVLNTAWGIALDPEKAPEGAADLDALRATSLNALESLSDDTLRRRLEWLMPLGGVTEELVQLRKQLWSGEPTRTSLKEYYLRLFSPDIHTYYFDEDSISQIKCPTLVLWTDKNPIHGPEAAHRLHEIIQGSDMHIMEGCAHWPQWERPSEHDQVVREFITTRISN